MPTYMTVNRLAEYLEIPRHLLDNARQAGTGPEYTSEEGKRGSIRYEKDQVNKWLEDPANAGHSIVVAFYTERPESNGDEVEVRFTPQDVILSVGGVELTFPKSIRQSVIDALTI